VRVDSHKTLSSVKGLSGRVNDNRYVGSVTRSSDKRVYQEWGRKQDKVTPDLDRRQYHF